MGDLTYKLHFKGQWPIKVIRLIDMHNKFIMHAMYSATNKPVEYDDDIQPILYEFDVV